MELALFLEFDDMFSPLIFILLLPILFSSFIVFDLLVRLEYKSYPKDWLADGKPHGFFWVATESRVIGGWLVKLGSSIAFNRCAMKWLFWTPDWMHGDEKALRLVFWLRVLVFIWNLGIIGSIIAGLLL